MRKGPRQGARRWFLMFLESSLFVPLSFTPDTEWESWVMTKAHTEDAGWGWGSSLGGRNKGLFTKNFSISHL